MSRAPVLLDLDRGDPAVAGLLERLLDGSIDGFLVRGALPDDVVERALAAATALPRVHSPMFPGYTHGELLVVSDPKTYFDHARALQAALEERGVTGAVHDVLTAVAAPRPVEVPVAADGRPYASLTVRVLEHGQAVAVHSERWEWDTMAHLRTTLHPERHLSFYVPLASAERGGELVVYHRPERPPSLDAAPFERAHEILEPFGATVVAPGPGDLIVFDGGRFNHRVVAIGGHRPRVTMGGFLALSAARDRVLYWS